MTRSLSRSHAILLTLVVLGAIALAGWTTHQVRQRFGHGPGAMAAHSEFHDVAGIQVGTRVRYQGLDAGEVEALIPPSEPGRAVTVKLHLSGKVRGLVRADTRVQIVSENLLGDKILKLLPGKADAVPLEEGGQLASVEAPDLAENLARASSQLSLLLSQAENALADFQQGQGKLGAMANDLTIATARLNKVLGQVDDLLTGVEKGEGALGQLVKSNEAYGEAMQSLQDVRKMILSVKQNSDAIKSLPVVRSYVVDAHKELVRPDCDRFVQWFPQDALFEPGRAILTPAGKKTLDGAAAWLNEHKEPGSEVVIAAYASPNADADVAKTVTQKQAEAALEYLRSQHSVQRLGWWWWSNRTTKALGVGSQPPALPESASLPSARLELLVFVPRR